MIRLSRRMARHRFRVNDIGCEPAGMVSFYLLGEDVDRLTVRPGQSFRLRLLTGRGWWRVREAQVSALPTARGLRVTTPMPGCLADQVDVGTRALLEGPFGHGIPEGRGGRGAVLIAAGAGAIPLRALLEQFAHEQRDAFLIYRADTAADIVFREEFELFAGRDGIEVMFLVGRSDDEYVTDVLTPAGLLRWLPDLAARDIYLSGPSSHLEGFRHVLHALAVPDDHLYPVRH